MKHIIIAEDSLTQAELLAYTLEQAGYTVQLGENGEEVLKMMDRQIPQLVISDVMMPIMNGYELCRHIKQSDALRRVPVLLLTTLTEPEDILIGLECGADSYLMKPYEQKVLLSKVDLLIRSSDSQDPVTDHEFLYEGRKYNLKTSRRRILDLMITTYEVAKRKNLKLQEIQSELHHLRSSLEKRVEERTADLQHLVEERRQIEASIRRSEQKNRNLLENALLGMVVTDLSGRIKYCNSTFAHMGGGKSEQDFRGDLMQKLLPALPAWRTLFSEMKAGKNLTNREVRVETSHSGPRWVLLNASMIRNEYTLTLLDISARIDLEEREKEAQKELLEAKERSEQSERQKTQFLKTMSHEIKTPLNAVSGFSGLAVDEGTDQARRAEYLVHVRNNSQELSRTMLKILELAKLEASKIKLSPAPCELKKVFRELEEEWYAISGRERNGGVSFSVSLDAAIKDGTFELDVERIKQIFFYLIENAWKHTLSGRIQIGCELRGQELSFFIRDTGLGIPAGFMPQVFERFNRCNISGARQSRGLGLGLTISDKLVRMMKGRIWMESVVGKGTEVYFTVPVLRKDQAIEDKPIQTDRSMADILSGKKLLVAEDNPMNYMLIKAYLDRYEMAISWAKDGEEAVELYRSGDEFDAVLMDVLMPKMDGCTAAREIKKLNRDIPILAVTASNLSDESSGACREAFDEVLMKPISEQEITGALVRYLTGVPQE